MIMTTLKKHFVYQSDYQHWANDKLFDSLDVLDDEARHSNQGMVFESMHKTVNHILLVTRNWMSRLKQEQAASGHDEMYVADWKELKHALRQEFRGMQRWLEARPEMFFDEKVDDPNDLGLPSQLWVRDALTHVMTHAAHQRGQVIAVAVRLGAPVPELDFIFYKREMERSLENLRGGKD